jgi:anti-sigma factor RsiW
MRKHCEKTQSLLERYFDGELSARKNAYAEDHLADCPHCAAELESLRRTRGAIQQSMRDATNDVDFSTIWRAVESRLEESKPTLWERLGVAARELVSVYKPIWATATAAVAVAAIVAVPLLVRESAVPTTPQSNECIIESIETSGSTAMIYDIDQDQTKVIWLFEDPEDSSDEPSSL